MFNLWQEGISFFQQTLTSRNHVSLKMLEKDQFHQFTRPFAPKQAGTHPWFSSKTQLNVY